VTDIIGYLEQYVEIQAMFNAIYAWSCAFYLRE